MKKLFFSKPLQTMGKVLLFLFGGLGILLCLTITVLVFVRGLPLFLEHGAAAVLLGREWRPHSGKYGMLPLILSTLYAMVGSLLVCVPFAILAALFIHGFMGRGSAGVCLNLMMTLARIPSVIYGLLGIVLLLPFLQHTLSMGTGFSLLAVVLVLGAALLPQLLVALLLAIRNVPAGVTKASLALGATKTETWFFSLLPHIAREIVSATLTCAGRAVGETILVAMVAGSISHMPKLLEPVSTLALEASGTFMGLDGETGKALFAAALVLLVMVAVICLARRLFVKRGKD